jgi:hypothetical protein
VKAGVRLDRVAAEGHVTKNLAVVRVKVVRGRRGVVKGVRKAEAVRVVRVGIAVRGLVAGASISRRISISKS